MPKLKSNKIIILLETIRNGYRSLEQKIFNICKEIYIGLDKSKIVKWLINSYKKLQYKTSPFLKTSIINSSIEELKKECHFFRIKTLGIIIVAAVLTNISVSIILKKEIGLFGWIIRGLFLSLGLISLSCAANKK